MKGKILYDYYLDGVENGKQFGYVPDFNSVDAIKAYTLGYSDCKNKRVKNIDEFEQLFNLN